MPPPSISLNNQTLDQSTMHQAPQQGKTSKGFQNTLGHLMSHEGLVNASQPAHKHEHWETEFTIKALITSQKKLLQTRPSSSSSPHLKALTVLEHRGFKPKQGGLEIPVRANGLLGGVRPHIPATKEELNHAIRTENRLIIQLNTTALAIQQRLDQLTAQSGLELTEPQLISLVQEQIQLQKQGREANNQITNAGNRIIAYQEQLRQLG